MVVVDFYSSPLAVDGAAVNVQLKHVPRRQLTQAETERELR